MTFGWPAILSSVLGAGLLGFVGSLIALLARRPLTRAEVTEKVEEISARALDRMERELVRRAGQVEEMEVRHTREKAEYTAEIAALRLRVRELEVEVASLRRTQRASPDSLAT